MDVETGDCRRRNRVFKTEQRVGNVEEVQERNIARAHPCTAGAELDRAIYRHRHGPEQTARIRVYPRVEVVDLGGVVREVILTPVQVQSNKSEAALVHSTVLADVDAGHEAHVSVEEE